MDDTEDDARYPPKHYSINHHTTHPNSSQRSKLPIRNTSYTHTITNSYHHDDDDEDDEQEVDDFDGYNEENDDDGDGDGDDDYNDDPYNYRDPKRRKLKNSVSNYEFAPRAAANLPSGSGRKSPFGVRNSPADWTEHSTFVLLEAWGDRYLQLGRKSLRSEDWTEVAEKVSEVSKIERTDMQCRNRLDTLKKKYKKEKAKLEEMRGGSSSNSKCVYFKKMDMLMSASPSRNYGLACGVDSGEYVFMNPKVYLNCSNGFDEMRDSPANSESCDGEEDDDLDGRRRFGGDDNDDDGSSSFRLLADSVQKFGEIYEKIENSKRQQMMELEKMRMNFHRELELQKKQILERAQVEIEKIRQGDDEDTDDASAENLSG